MITLGTDAHKSTHTTVPIDEVGRPVGRAHTTAGTTTCDHLELLAWARQFPNRVWAIEDCRPVSRRLELDLLLAGERIKRVPPKLVAAVRDSVRTPGKSDPIDALAIGRAALREPNLPVAQLDNATREVRLLVNHRDDLVAERTRHINRLRWYLHELEPGWDPPAKDLCRVRPLDRLTEKLHGFTSLVARLAIDCVARIRELTVTADALEAELITLVTPLVPTLLGVVGVGALSAAKILGHVGDIRRFRNADAFARHNGTAPIPVWSGNPGRHRLNRGGDRQLNAAIHRIAIAQQRWHPDASTYTDRRRSEGKTATDTRRRLKRHLSNVIYRALLADAHLLDTTNPTPLTTAA